jgi:hypothetical protein
MSVNGLSQEWECVLFAFLSKRLNVCVYMCVLKCLIFMVVLEL